MVCWFHVFSLFQAQRAEEMKLEAQLDGLLADLADLAETAGVQLDSPDESRASSVTSPAATEPSATMAGAVAGHACTPAGLQGLAVRGRQLIERVRDATREQECSH